MRIARTLSPGHPDRLCDMLAETILDEYLRRDPATSMRVHVSGGRGAIFVSGVVSSKADFDVGSLVVRTAAALGVRKHVEPFVSLESVPGSFVLEATRSSRPISVTGYAAAESEESLPGHVSLSRRLAKKLEDARQRDPEWFWLSPSFEIIVAESYGHPPIIHVNCGHGEEDLANVSARIKQLFNGETSGMDVRVNHNGPIRANGLDVDMGNSGISADPYGSGIYIRESVIGYDPSHPVKFGSWLARGLASMTLRRTGSKAVMVQAVYLPGESAPSYLRVRNERGADLADPTDADGMRYAKLASMLRYGLNADAARWGFAGEAGLPWEPVDPGSALDASA